MMLARNPVTVISATKPPVVRAVGEASTEGAWRIVDEAVSALTDATVRRILIEEDFQEAIEDRDRQADPQVAWLEGLLCARHAVRWGDWMAHGTNHALPIVNEGELAVIYCFVFLFICAHGPGIWSVDASRGADG